MSDIKIAPDWIAVACWHADVQAYAMRGAQMLEKMERKVAADQNALPLDFAAHWALSPDTVIVACGPVEKWFDLRRPPFRTVPCPPVDPQSAQNQTRPTLYAIPGIRQTAPPGVLHGEETQIAGFLELNPGWDGVLCISRPHTKWVEVSAGEIVSFQSFMTGEMLALLSENSDLRAAFTGQDWDESAFASSLADAMSKPERLAARLSELHAQALLSDGAPAPYAQLCGLLIGAELAAARPYWLGRQIALLGDDDLAGAYDTALKAQGVPVIQTDADRMLLAGLTSVYRRLHRDGS